MTMPIPLVVLPGLDGTEVFFRPFLARLPASIRPLVVRYPQSGATGYPDLLAQVRHAAADLPAFYVFGSSFAGPLAIMLSAAEPTKVRGIILSASFLSCPRPDLARIRFAAVGPVIWSIRALRRIPVWMRAPQDPFRQAKAETWSRVSANALAARARAALAVDVRETFRACTLPVLCAHFEDDKVVSRAFADEIQRLLPSARFVTLPGGHLGMLHDPAPLTHEVVRFIEQLEKETYQETNVCRPRSSQA